MRKPACETFLSVFQFIKFSWYPWNVLLPNLPQHLTEFLRHVTSHSSPIIAASFPKVSLNCQNSLWLPPELIGTAMLITLTDLLQGWGLNVAYISQSIRSELFKKVAGRIKIFSEKIIVNGTLSYIFISIILYSPLKHFVHVDSFRNAVCHMSATLVRSQCVFCQLTIVADIFHSQLTHLDRFLFKSRQSRNHTVNNSLSCRSFYAASHNIMVNRWSFM